MAGPEAIDFLKSAPIVMEITTWLRIFFIESRRKEDFITPIPKPKKRKGNSAQDAKSVIVGRVKIHPRAIMDAGFYGTQCSTRTGVPTGAFSKNLCAAPRGIRMHPCEAG